MFRFDPNALPDGQPGDTSAQGDDFAGQFVATLMRLPGPVWVLPSVQM
jgi:hypothetical protein